MESIVNDCIFVVLSHRRNESFIDRTPTPKYDERHLHKMHMYTTCPTYARRDLRQTPGPFSELN